MPTQDKDAGRLIDRTGMDTTSSDVEDNTHSNNISSINRVHKIENDEESGVYFWDGLRKIDLVLAYDGKYMKFDNNHCLKNVPIFLIRFLICFS